MNANNIHEEALNHEPPAAVDKENNSNTVSTIGSGNNASGNDARCGNKTEIGWKSDEIIMMCISLHSHTNLVAIDSDMNANNIDIDIEAASDEPPASTANINSIEAPRYESTIGGGEQIDVQNGGSLTFLFSNFLRVKLVKHHFVCFFFYADASMTCDTDAGNIAIGASNDQPPDAMDIEATENIENIEPPGYGLYVDGVDCSIRNDIQNGEYLLRGS